MFFYRITLEKLVQRMPDGAIIEATDPDYQAWLGEGNEPLNETVPAPRRWRYEYLDENRVRRVEDGVTIFRDPNSGPWQEYEGWVAAGNEPIMPPPPSLDDLKAAKKQALAAIRWEHQVAGATIFSLGRIPTDRETRSSIVETLALIDEGVVSNVKWKLPSGFVTLDRAGLVQLGAVVAAHVQACFDHEAELSGLIDLAEDTDELSDIDLTEGWPV